MVSHQQDQFDGVHVGHRAVVRAAVEPAVKTEVSMSGQLALTTGEEVVAAAVWETLPPASQQAIAVRLARLVARLVEAERDE